MPPSQFISGVVQRPSPPRYPPLPYLHSGLSIFANLTPSPQLLVLPKLLLLVPINSFLIIHLFSLFQQKSDYSQENFSSSGSQFNGETSFAHPVRPASFLFSICTSWLFSSLHSLSFVLIKSIACLLLNFSTARSAPQ